MCRAQVSFCLILSLVLAGCGFQLRGVSSVPEAIQPLALKCDTNVSELLCQAIESQLALGEVSMADASEAVAVLILSDFSEQRRASAVTARAAAAEYTLRQSVKVEVVSADQKPLIAAETVTTSETYRYDDTNVLAKQREEEALQEQLAQRLAQQVLFRLAPLNQTRLDVLEAAE